MTNLPKGLIFASGSKNGGGSGFLYLLLAIVSGVLKMTIVGVVSNYENGGVRKIADKYGIPFYYFPNNFTAENYQRFARESGAEWFILSGWLKFVRGLPVEKTFNIHPGCTDEFGGPGMYGHHVHEAVMTAFAEDKVSCSYVSMHFADEVGYDHGNLFFKIPVGIDKDDDADSLGSRVNEFEHGWQAYITNLIVNGEIRLVKGQVYVPTWYKEEIYCPDNCQAA